MEQLGTGDGPDAAVTSSLAERSSGMPAPQKWCIITWAPPASGPTPEVPGVTVHHLPSHFGLDALRVLRRVIREQPADVRVLVQYVPTGFGWRMMNVPFAFLLFRERSRGLDIYFHEVGFEFTWRQRWRRNVAALVHLVMNWLTARAANRAYVAISEWQYRLSRFGGPWKRRVRQMLWVPVPSNVPDVADGDRVDDIRKDLRPRGMERIVGHFGTFGRYHLRVLSPAFERVLDEDTDRIALFVGRNSETMRATLARRRQDLMSRIHATGGLEAADVSAHVAACDVLVQPYDDGISARRGSLMAGLALGVPVIGNRGPIADEVWTRRSTVLLADSDDSDTLSAAVSALLADPARAAALGEEGRRLYRDEFALERGVARLRNVRSAILEGRAEQTVPRVLILHTTLPESGRKPGGVEIAVHRLSNALVDIGVPVTVASLTPAPADARYVHRHLFPRSWWLRDSRFGRLVVLPALLNVIRLSGADVVHYHGDDWFVIRRPRATVRTLHGSALREAQRATRWPRRLVQYALFPLEKLAARLATVSVAVGTDAAELHGLRRVIGNGVDSTLFTPGPKSAVPELLYVGTWEGRKRGRWMYETFVSRIAPRHPDVVLRFISDKEPPPHPRVRYERFPSDVELARAYREAWVFVLPSTYEGFGIPYLEAMSSGTAVVASPNTGASELLDKGRYGMLVNDDAFADTVLRLIDDAPARERLVAAGLERAREYSWSAVARAYLSVYRDALALRAPAGGS